MRLLLALLIACADPSHPAGSKAPRDSSPRPAGETGPSGETGPDSADPSTPPWSDDACQGLDLGDDPFAADIAAFADDTPPTGGLLAVGSSTIRRWRSFQRSLSPYDPLQRGVGGALFARTLRAAREAGITAIDATIRADNTGGLAFYARLGFVDYDRMVGVPLRNGAPVDRIRKRFDIR
jgi:RimJ/RimL family protein N-acetyltransferase